MRRMEAWNKQQTQHRWVRKIFLGKLHLAKLAGERLVLLGSVSSLKPSKENTRWLGSAFEGAAIGMVIKDIEGKLLRSNPAFQRMLGYEEGELQTMFRRDFTHPEDAEKDNELYLELLQGDRESFQIDKRYIKKGGGTMWGRLSVSRIEDEDGGPPLAMGVVEDISELKKAEAALGASESRFRSVVEQSPLSIHVFAPDGRSIRANDSWNQLWYLDDGEEPEGANIFEDEYLHVAGLIPYVRDGADGIGAKIPPMLFDPARAGGEGEPRWLEGVIYPLRDATGGITEVTLMLDDVTERKTLESTLVHQALHDPLTNLPNRTLFLDRLSQAFARLRRRPERNVEQDDQQKMREPADDNGQNVGQDVVPYWGSQDMHQEALRKELAVLFLDLDNLKHTNDSLGHNAGDRLLVEVAQRLASRLRPADTLARLAGDEFVILLEEAGEAEAVLAAERIIQGVGEPFAILGEEIFVSISVGIALGKGHVPGGGQPTGHEAEILLKDADLAMYEAKKRGKACYVLYEERMGQEASTRLKAESDLRRAVERHEFEVYYQPKVSLESNLVAGVEALARWRHPERGLVLPAEFIGLAEQTGLIVELGYQVLRMALMQAREWREHWQKHNWQGMNEKLSPPVVWVNLSARQFHEPDLAGHISDVLTEAGVEPNALGLEITESILIEDASPSVSLLQDLKSLGVKLAVDDFGTGYSSLSYLTRLPVDYLKIDRSFITGLDSATENIDYKGNTGSMTVVSAVIGLARAMRMKVVAEGVETQEQILHLKEMGCDLAQGYLLSRPLPAREASAYLDTKLNIG